MRSERRLIVLLALVASLATSGCFSRHRTGWWADDAFYVSRQHYRVRYLAGGEGQRRLLPQGWRLDNWRVDPSGAPLEALSGFEHTEHVSFDQDGDGRIDMRASQSRYELHYQHLEHDAVVWAATTPLDRISSERSLESFLRLVVDSFTGAAEQVGKGEIANVRRRRGVRLVEEGPATLQSSSDEPVSARGVVFEVVDLDARDQNRDAVLGLVELLVARPPQGWSESGGPGQADDPPMVVFYGFAARGDVFAQLRPEFQGFLDRVDFR